MEKEVPAGFKLNPEGPVIALSNEAAAPIIKYKHLTEVLGFAGIDGVPTDDGILAGDHLYRLLDYGTDRRGRLKKGPGDVEGNVEMFDALIFKVGVSRPKYPDIVEVVSVDVEQGNTDWHQYRSYLTQALFKLETRIDEWVNKQAAKALEKQQAAEADPPPKTKRERMMEAIAAYVDEVLDEALKNK